MILVAREVDSRFLLHMNMNSPTAQFLVSRRMNIYEPLHQISSWVDSFRDDGFPNVSPSTVVEVNERLDTLVHLINIMLFVLHTFWSIINSIMFSTHFFLTFCFLNLQSEDTSSHGGQAPSNRYDQEASKPTDKVTRITVSVLPEGY